MKLENRIAQLPQGRSNPVFKWMLKEMAFGGKLGRAAETCTELAERAAYAFDRDAWLNDPDHYVWDAACLAFEVFENPS